MTRAECRCEADVLAAVSTSCWPDRVEPELRDHVAICAICTDVVAVASAFEEESRASRSSARVPDSGLVWWRAQLRARQDAARTAARPITVAQMLAFAATVGVAGAVFGATATWFQQGLRWLMGGASSALTFQVPRLPAEIMTFVASHGLLIAGGGAFFLIAPLAIYLGVRWSERPA
jgi:hypothetical protein